MPRAALHPDWLLCERCGYRLDALPHDAPCPECGRPVVDSLPARRDGAAWQRRPGLVPWLATNWTTLRHPWKRWDEVRVASAYGLMLANTGFASVVAALLVVGAGGHAASPTELPLLVGMAVALVWPAVNVLSLIEALGLRVLGARNGWRVTKEVAAAVVAHASIGWLLGLPVLLAEILYFRSLTGMDGLAWMFAAWWWEVLAWAAAPLAGLFGFELLAWLGWRKMKFANREARQPKD